MKLGRMISSNAMILGVGIGIGLVMRPQILGSHLFQLGFGIAAGIVTALVVGTYWMQAVDRKYLDRMKRRVRVANEDGKTTITLEPDCDDAG